jgi:hypothetical protein
MPDVALSAMSGSLIFRLAIAFSAAAAMPSAARLMGLKIAEEAPGWTGFC